MMKLYKLLFAFLLLPTILIANDKKKHEKSKTINRTFAVTKNATLYLNNKYGNINVTTWNKNSVEINIKITVKGSDLDNVEQKLKSIDVNFEATENLVEARTTFEEIKSNWSFWKSNNNTNYQVNYFVKMPVTNNADFNNKYGNIIVDTLKGKTNIDCDYGNLEIESLLNKSNNITLDYCGSSEINFINSGNINIDYSKLTIDETNTVKINADYSTVKIGKATNMDFNSDYGSIYANKVASITGDSDYASVKIGTLTKNLNISTDYGSIKVEEVAIGFENIVIDGSFAGIKLGINQHNSFKFKVDVSYAGFKYPKENTELFKSIKKSTKKHYEGFYGNSNTNAFITIKSKYGGVSLKTND